MTTQFYTVRERLANFIFPEGLDQRNHAIRSANICPLTGLANKGALQLALPMAEFEEDTAIIMFDANNFGKINKHLGHDVGDAMIIQIAKALSAAAKEHGYSERVFRSTDDEVFRYGGDEFVIICPKSCAEAIRDTAEKLFGVRTVYNVSISGQVGNTFKEADTALQARKHLQKAEQVVTVRS